MIFIGVFTFHLVVMQSTHRVGRGQIAFSFVNRLNYFHLFRYYNSIASHDQRRTLRMRSTANYDIERNEFLCPLCQTLSNTVIPVLPSLRSLSRDRKFAQMSFTEWLDGLEKALNGSIESRYEMETHEQQIFFNPCPLTSITKMMAERAAQNFQLLFGFAGDSR